MTFGQGIQEQLTLIEVELKGNVHSSQNLFSGKGKSFRIVGISIGGKGKEKLESYLSMLTTNKNTHSHNKRNSIFRK